MQRPAPSRLRGFGRSLWPALGAVSFLALTVTGAHGRAGELDPAAQRTPEMDLLQLSLEELGKIKVTTVSRKTETLSGAAAAIHVITQEELRRSGVTTVAEALRMAPGLNVARANSRQWAISSRGFNGTYANKLLVLLDGRTLYTPMFSGVFWEETDAVLEDVNRIEVIRGPGATMWGANAVNGVINIITKTAQETQGTLISGGGGMEEQGFGTVRYGGQLATNVYYRVYDKYSSRDEFTLTDGSGAADSWWIHQGGFRLDWEASAANRATLQGDYFYGDLGGKILRQSLNPPGVWPTEMRAKTEGANVLGRWTHDFSSQADLSAQVYYDRTDRGFGIGREIRDTVDLDAQHRFHLGERHEIVWGVGYRYSVDDITATPDFATADPSMGLQLASGFVQDEMVLLPDRLNLTFGTKVEHNDFTGFEVQPSGRIAWTPRASHTVWGSISRAVRTPSRIERGFSIFSQPPASFPPLPVPVIVSGSGSPHFDSEDLLAYELGYRVQLHPRLSLDWTGFYNEYDRLWGAVTLPVELKVSPDSQPYLLIPATVDNAMSGETYGTEVLATWQPVDWWRLRVSYTLLQMNLRTQGPVRSVSEESVGASPQHQAFLASEIDLGRHVEWGMGLRYVDDLPSDRIPGYTELDARLAWKPTRNCELAVIGRNLLAPRHREFAPLVVSVRDVEVERAVYAKITWRF